MSKKYPFKFLDSYQKEDKDFFFGRKDEVDQLYKMIFKTRIMMVYGTSGTGKTSLIQCGLANKFKTYDWLSLYIRKGSNLVASLDRALCNEIEEPFNEDENKFTIDDLSGKLERVYKSSFRPIYLIFDQFEELYVIGSKKEQEGFVQVIKEILSVDRPVKIIFSIREEYLGYLYDFEKEVPQLLRKKLRVEPMTQDKLLDVTEGINQYKDSLVTIKADEIHEITRELFERLNDDKKTLTIQLPYLQVFLDKLYMNKTKDSSHQKEAIISLEDLKQIGDIEDVLQDFLDREVKKIARDLSSKKKEIKPEIIWSILSNFCTIDGTKEPTSKKTLVGKMGKDLNKSLIEKSVDAFTKRRILKESDDEDLYELTHDSLALRIVEKRSLDDIAKLEVKRLIVSKAALKGKLKEYLTEEQLFFIKDYEAVLESDLGVAEKNLIKESKRKVKSKKRTKRVLLGLVFLLVVGVASYFGYTEHRNLKEYQVMYDVYQLKKIVDSAKVRQVNSASILDRNPTLAMKMSSDASELIDSAKAMDTLRNKSYGLISRFEFMKCFQETAYNEYDKYIGSTDSLVRVQVSTIVGNDHALHDIVYPSNSIEINDVLKPYYSNLIFPDKKDESKFTVWSLDKGDSELMAKFNEIESDTSKIFQIVFPRDENEAMVLYKDGIAEYVGKNKAYKKLELATNDRINSIAPIQYQVIGYKMLAAMNKERIMEWNLNGKQRESSGKLVRYVKRDNDLNDRVVSIAISPNRSRIFTASDKGIGILWEADTTNVRLKPLRLETFNLLQNTIKCSAYSNDGTWVATGSTDGIVKIWNAINGKPIKVLYGHHGAVTSVAFSAKDKYLYTGSMDGKFRKWTLPARDSISKMPVEKWQK